jgi:hypothetical protein
VRVGVPPSRQGTIHKGALVDVVGEMFGGGKHPLKPLPAGARSRFTRPIPWGHLLVPSPFVQGPDGLFDLPSRTTRNRQPCIFPRLGAQTPASRILRINSFGTGSGFNRRIDRVVSMISNRSGPSLSSGTVSSLARDWFRGGCPIGQLGVRIARGALICSLSQKAGPDTAVFFGGLQPSTRRFKNARKRRNFRRCPCRATTPSDLGVRS